MDDNWHYVACTYDGTKVRAYVDGNLEDEVPYSDGIGLNDEPVRIGFDPATFLGPRFFNGLIDEVEIFNRALCGAEIQAIFNAGSAGKCEGGEVVFCIDHFLCYKAKSTKGNICSSDSPSNAGGSCEVEEDCGGTEDDTDFCVPNKFPKGVQASLNDQFEDKDFVVKKPVNLCAPADKNDEGIKNDDTHLMCYQAKPAIGEPRHTPVIGIHVNNQFGAEQLDTIKEDELCVPSTKTRPPP